MLVLDRIKKNKKLSIGRFPQHSFQSECVKKVRDTLLCIHRNFFYILYVPIRQKGSKATGRGSEPRNTPHNFGFYIETIQKSTLFRKILEFQFNPIFFRDHPL